MNGNNHCVGYLPRRGFQEVWQNVVYKYAANERKHLVVGRQMHGIASEME